MRTVDLILRLRTLALRPRTCDSMGPNLRSENHGPVASLGSSARLGQPVPMAQGPAARIFTHVRNLFVFIFLDNAGGYTKKEMHASHRYVYVMFVCLP